METYAVWAVNDQSSRRVGTPGDLHLKKRHDLILLDFPLVVSSPVMAHYSKDEQDPSAQKPGRCEDGYVARTDDSTGAVSEEENLSSADQRTAAFLSCWAKGHYPCNETSILITSADRPVLSVEGGDSAASLTVIWPVCARGTISRKDSQHDKNRNNGN